MLVLQLSVRNIRPEQSMGKTNTRQSYLLLVSRIILFALLGKKGNLCQIGWFEQQASGGNPFKRIQEAKWLSLAN